MLCDLLISNYASELRSIAGLSDSEPVGDIREIIEKQEYIYTEKSLPKEFAAESKIENSGFHITFNTEVKGFGEKFHRFTMGHELGHWNIPAHFEKLQEIKLHRSAPEGSSAADIEREADKFSIYFLAPIQSYQKQMLGLDFSIPTIEHLSGHFNISDYAAILHFMQLTDLTCSLIVCNEKFEIEWERRSDRMKDTFKMTPLKKTKLPERTMTFDCIKRKESSMGVDSFMSDWYSDFPHKMACTESVLRLGYNGKYLVFLTPESADYNMYLEETDQRD
ncbi:MAG: hypothetical protein JXI43_04720 [Tissierellales bacterium]|nr:hypothetical protein [Tissierellales bacterium]